jgi:heme-degrading monooxygenase HmoA
VSDRNHLPKFVADRRRRSPARRSVQVNDPLAAAGHRAGVWMWSILRHAVPVILEHALLPVKPGEEAAFESAFAEAKAIIAGMPGFLRLTLSRCLEHPNTDLLLVAWDRLVDHAEGFRGSPQYQKWRRSGPSSGWSAFTSGGVDYSNDLNAPAGSGM